MRKQRKKKEALTALYYMRTVPLTFLKKVIPHLEETQRNDTPGQRQTLRIIKLSIHRATSLLNAGALAAEGKSLLDVCKPSHNLHIIKRGTSTFNAAAVTRQTVTNLLCVYSFFLESRLVNLL